MYEPIYMCIIFSVMGTKTIKTIRFPKDMNKSKLNFKSQIIKQKHDMCKIIFQQDFITKINKYKTRL
jgi:hypothetical protein